MADITQSPARREKLELPARDMKRTTVSAICWGLLFIVLMWSWEGAEMRPLDLMTYAGNMGQFAAGFFPPDFHNWPTFLEQTLITIQIAIWGTVLAVICAVPFGILCAENIAPWWIYQPTRRLMDAARAINEMVFAMLFVVAVGLGPFAGVLALWVHTTGILAKLFPAVLLVPLALRRRWRALGWTAGTSAALVGLTLVVFGSAPFTAFFHQHLPRLADGSAFAFGEAWPEVADLVTAGNQGVHGVVAKLDALGWVDADGAVAQAAPRAFAALLFALALVVGLARNATRHEHATMWVGLLGLGSLASAGAWADYVPLTAVWALALLAPFAAGRPFLAVALAVSALFQVFLIGTMPIGEAADASWMMPLSLFGSIAMFATLGGATLVHVLARGTVSAPAVQADATAVLEPVSPS